jgi:polyhydroxyalkanoate synthesis regulator phasin
MPQTGTSARQKASTRDARARARAQSKAFVERLTDAGEEAMQRLAELPGGQRALGAFNELRGRVDELGKKVRGIEELERRIAKLEKQVADLKSPKRAAPRRASARRTTTRPT